MPGTPQALYFLITGPDGNLWFTDPNGNDVGKVLVKAPNTVSVYPDPLDGASPRDIKCGPDGALWTTEQGTHTLGQVHLTDNPATTARYSAACRSGILRASVGIAPGGFPSGPLGEQGNGPGDDSESQG